MENISLKSGNEPVFTGGEKYAKQLWSFQTQAILWFYEIITDIP